MEFKVGQLVYVNDKAIDITAGKAYRITLVRQCNGTIVHFLDDVNDERLRRPIDLRHARKIRRL